IGVAADETVEVIEPESRRPQVEWPSLAGLPVRHVVVLPIPRRVVSVLLEHLGERPDALRHQRVVAGIAGAELHDHARVRGVMVASCDQRGTGRRTERGGMKLRVAQPGLGETVHRRRRKAAPYPASSVRMSSMLGAPAGAWTSLGKSGDDSLTVRPILP